MCDKTMHYSWFAVACAEAFGEYQVAVDCATFNQLTDDATSETLPCRMMPGGKRPFPTQGEIADGVYAVLSGGFHADYERIMVFHFPGPQGMCEAGACDRALERAADDLHERIEGDVGFRGTPSIEEQIQLCCAMVGIVGHGALDDDAHGTFLGMPSARNACPWGDWRWGNPLSAALPNRCAIGHSEYAMLPDTVGRKWKRHGATVDNRVVYLQAAASVWNCLRPDLAVEVVPGEWDVRPMHGGTTIPKCLTLMVSSAANKGEWLTEACGKAFWALTGKELPPYQIPPLDSPMWFAFQQAALTRLGEVLR